MPSDAGAAIVPAARTPTESTSANAPPHESDAEHPIVRVVTARGKLAVWSESEGKTSIVVAGYETRPGTLAAPAKVLRRTSGTVGALDVVVLPNDADPSGGTEDVAVAWASGLADDKGQVAALVFGSADLTRVTAPTTLGIVDAPIAVQGHVAVARSPRGGVVVAHQGATGRCDLSGTPVECVTFEVEAVGLDGKRTKLGGGKLHGGPSPELTLVDLDGRGLAVYASSMRGGRTVASAVVPYVATETAPAFVAPVCVGLAAFAPEIVRGAGGELVAVCLDAREKDTCAKPLRDDPDRCPHVAVTGRDGRPATKGAPVTRVVCVDGTIEATYASGRVRLAKPSRLLADFVTGCR